MGAPPDEKAARLERWAAEQQQLARKPSSAKPTARERVWWKVRPLWWAVSRPWRPVSRLVDRAGDRIASLFFDRNRQTAGRADEPEHYANPDRSVNIPSAWHTLPRALRYVGASPDDTFIDFGCGQGRVVHQAAKRPFRRVIGVEVSPRLAEIARAMVEAHAGEYRCKNVEIVAADAREYRVPDDLTIAYFFHPFQGETLDVVLKDIVGSIDRSPRRLVLIYAHPRGAEQVLATGRFRLLKEFRGGLRRSADHLHRTYIYESTLSQEGESAVDRHPA